MPPYSTGEAGGAFAGSSVAASGQLGLNAAAHIATMGFGGEVGGLLSTDQKGCFYIKVCATAGLGLYAGAGVSGGLGLGEVSSGPQTTSGVLLVGGLGGQGGVSIEGNTSGVGMNWGSVRYGGGGGACVAVQECKYFYYCKQF